MDSAGLLPKFDERVLIFAPFGRDAVLMREVLSQAKVECRICMNMAEACVEANRGAAVLLLTQEALFPETLTQLEALLTSQPPWSDLPIITLLTPGKKIAPAVHESDPRLLGRMTVLERPVSKRTLLSAVQASLRARDRQYQTRDLLKSVEDAKRAAESANIVKSEFIANISHEIRTPLGVILGFVSLALETESPSTEQSFYLTTVDRNAKQLLKLINEVLDLAKVEAEKLELEALEFSVGDLLRDLQSDLGLKAREKGIRLRIESTGTVPATFVSDPMRVRQILINIVGNALKFTESGSVTLKLKTMSDSKTGETLRFEIRDTGIGLAQEQQDRLFQPFTQADSSTNRKFGGSGLGLVVSKKLAVALGGDLVLHESAPGKGSTFIFTLPPIVNIMRGAQLVSSVAEARRTKTTQGVSELKGVHILLVEDSADNQAMVSRFLARAGATVDIASDGEEGVKKALSAPYDAVLMDLQMPVVDGHEATRRLRTSGYTTPIFAFTAHAMKGEQERTLEAGFNGYLTKPVDREILITTLKHCCTDIASAESS